MRRGFHWAWVILAVSFVNAFISYGIRLGYGVVLPEMIRSIGLTRTQGGAIFNFYILGYLLLSPVAGSLTDRYGARWVITCFMALLGIGTLMMGTADNFWSAAIYFAIVGIGGAAVWGPALTTVQHWFSPKRRGVVIGVISAGGSLGFAFSGWLFPRLVEAYSWRFCWYLFGVWALIMVPLNSLLLRSKPEELDVLPWGDTEAGKPEKSGQNRSIEAGRLKPFYRSKVFWTIGLSYALASFSLYLVTTFVVDYADMELGFSFQQASLIASIHGLMEVVGVLTISSLSDYIGRRLTLFGANLFSAFSILALIASGENLTGLYVSVAVLSLFYGVTWPMYGACSGDYFSKKIVGTVLGAWTLFFGVGAIFGHLVGGWTRDATGSYQGAFYLCVLLSLLAAFLIQRVSKPTGQGC